MNSLYIAVILPSLLVEPHYCCCMHILPIIADIIFTIYIYINMYIYIFPLLLVESNINPMFTHYILMINPHYPSYPPCS